MSRAAGSVGLLPILVYLAAALATSAGGLPGGSPSVSAAGAEPVPFVATSSPVAVAPAYAPPVGVADLGPVGENSSVVVDVGLASRDPAGLAAFVNGTAVPGTPSYRHFLPAAEADARFGALSSSVASAEAYFQGFGLSAVAHPDGLLLSVSGPAPEVARAFGTTFDLYHSASGATFVDHPSLATLPNVAPWTGAFGLTNRPAFEPEARVLSVEPAGASGTGCGAFTGILSPCQVAAAYDLAGLDAAGKNGSGQRIAVIDVYAPGENPSMLSSDLAQFSQRYGLPSGTVRFQFPVPTTADLNVSGTNIDWQPEDALDVEWAHAAAPGATIEMVFSPNQGTGLYFAIDWVVAQGEANVISMSWGEPEVGIFNPQTPPPCTSACNASSDGSFAILDPVLELAASEGITAFAASGDCGSADGTTGVAVNYPASDAFVTGVGATNLSLSPTGAYGGESGWGGNSSGDSASGCENLGGSGGGFSILPRPWWQTGNGTVPSGGRGVPDVAMVGGTASPVGIYSGGFFTWVSGTSVGTPIWAGIGATADQDAGSDLGWLNPSLYHILGSSNYTQDFHEVKSGSNGYAAHAGWNPVTGIGSPIVGNLTRDLARSPVAVSNLTTYAFASPRFGPAPLTVHFAVTVRGGSGTYPLLGVEFGDGNSSAVVAGGAEHTFLLAGVYSVQAYATDRYGNSSTSPPVVVVVGGGGPLSVGLNASSVSPPVGRNVTFTAGVLGGSGPYVYNFSFGDGTFADNLTVASVVHAYAEAGSFCAEVVVQDSATPQDGGASLRLAEAVGGAATGSCGNPSEPLSIRTNSGETVRDAPADFPSVFTVVGGSTAPDGLEPQFQLVSNDPYTAACACTILRAAGNYTFEESEYDAVDGAANATANVTVVPALQATFTASALAGPVPLDVTFSANATGGFRANASATRWTFGNGQSARGSSVFATYASPGEYVAIASLADQGYGNASEAFVLDAQPPSSAEVGLTATVSPAVNVSSGTTVRWAATPVGPASTLASSSVVWDLGNGGSAFGHFANETYFAPADLPAGDELAASVAVDTPLLTPIVRVPILLPGFFANESGGFVPAVDALALSQEVTSPAGLLPLAITGSANATGPGGVQLGWTFGDGGSATGGSVNHVYYGAGEFTVRVQAEDGFDDTADRLETVVANAALTVVGCGTSSRHGAAPYAVDLAPEAAGGTGPPYEYRWTLPNGTVSTATDVNLTFSAPGTYEVVLVVSDPSSETYGCVWSIVVSSLPPVAYLDVLVGGVVVGIALAVVFVVVTRPKRCR
jgi:kumamolisin